MYRLHLRAKARRDLKDIWHYTYENFGLAQADNYFDQLESAVETIQSNPKIGIACEYIRNGYRQLKVNHHYIFYRIEKRTIHVIRVLHESMQTFSHL